MTEWMDKWLITSGINSEGKPVMHWATLLELHNRIGEVERTKVGVYVC